MAVLMAAAVLAGAPERPDWLVRTGEAETYSNALRLFGGRALENFSGISCQDVRIAELDTRAMTLDDVPGTAGATPGFKERVRVDGCGQSSIQNLIVARPDPNASWQFSFAVPGESILQLVQQDHVLGKAVGIAERSLPRNCERVWLRDTYVIANPGRVDFNNGVLTPGDEPTFGLALAPDVLAGNKIDPAQAWAELWVFDACGSERGVAVVMMPTFDYQFIAVPISMDEYERANWPQRAVPRPSGAVSSGL